MHIHKDSTTDEINVKLPIKATEMALSRVNIPHNIPFADAGVMVSGVENFSIPNCDTRDAFIEAFKDCKTLSLHLKDEYFTLVPKRFPVGDSPEGLYQNDEKTMLITQNGGYFLSDYI